MGEIPNYTPPEEALIPSPVETPVVTEALTPEPVVIFDRQAYDKQWNKDKRTQRLANLAMAHGYVHTSSGRVYYDHGTSSRPRKTK